MIRVTVLAIALGALFAPQAHSLPDEFGASEEVNNFVQLRLIDKPLYHENIFKDHQLLKVGIGFTRFLKAGFGYNDVEWMRIFLQPPNAAKKRELFLYFEKGNDLAPGINMTSTLASGCRSREVDALPMFGTYETVTSGMNPLGPVHVDYGQLKSFKDLSGPWRDFSGFADFLPQMSVCLNFGISQVKVSRFPSLNRYFEGEKEFDLLLW